MKSLPHCHNHAASHYFSTVDAVSFILHPSASKECLILLTVILTNCLAWRRKLVMDTTFIIKNTLTWPSHCSEFAMPSVDLVVQASFSGKTELLFQDNTHKPSVISSYDLIQEL